MRLLAAVFFLFVVHSANAEIFRLKASYCDVWGDSLDNNQAAIEVAPNRLGCYSTAPVSRILFRIYKVNPPELVLHWGDKPMKRVRTNGRGMIKVRLQPGFYVFRASRFQLESEMGRYASLYCSHEPRGGNGEEKLFFVDGTARIRRYRIADRCPV